MTHDSSMSDSDTFKFLPWAPQCGTGLARPAWVSESDTNGTERCGHEDVGVVSSYEDYTRDAIIRLGKCKRCGAGIEIQLDRFGTELTRFVRDG